MENFADFRSAFGQQQESESEVTIPMPPGIPYEDFMKMELQEPKRIVKGLLDCSSRLIFGGGSKTYKTWAMLDLALSIAAKQPWWGFETECIPVYYLNFELQPYYMQQRCRHIQLSKKCENGPLTICNLRGYRIESREAFKTELIARIKDTGTQILFVDPFYKLLGDADERISAELNAVFREFDDITRETGTTIVCATHFTKGNQYAKESMDRISGGGSINRDPDNLITLTKHEVDGAFTVEFTNRDHAPIPAFVVEWKHPLLVRNDDLDPDDIKQPRTIKQDRNGNTEADLKLLDLLREHDDEFTKGQFVRFASDVLGWPPVLCFKKLKQFEAQKKIQISPITKNIGILPF